MEHLYGILDATAYVIRQLGSNILAITAMIAITWATPRIVKVIRTTRAQ